MTDSCQVLQDANREISAASCVELPLAGPKFCADMDTTVAAQFPSIFVTGEISIPYGLDSGCCQGMHQHKVLITAPKAAEGETDVPPAKQCMECGDSPL